MAQAMTQNYDVAIVGGGLVGLALACALRDTRLSVLVIEARELDLNNNDVPAAPRRQGYELASGYEPRVSAINPASRAFLKRAGVWTKCDLDRFAPFTRMSVWDGRGTCKIEFDAAMIGEDCLGYIVENKRLLHGLREQAEQLEGVDLRFGSTVLTVDRITDGYELRLSDDTRVRCRLLVGADGGNSRMRELANIRSVKWSYRQQALVTTIETEQPHGFTARQCFTDNGPLAFLPLADEKLCSIVWSSAQAERLRELSTEALCRELTRASEAVLGNVLGADKRYVFPLYQQHALSYTRDHLALIGDAAHTIHPLAGQGANLGFADANILAIELAQCRFNNCGPGDRDVLKRYQRRRLADNLIMAAVMEAFKRIYDFDDPRVNWLRNAGMRLVGGSPLLKGRVIRLASGC